MAKAKPTATVAKAASVPKATRPAKPKTEGIEKKVLATRPVCKVTFALPKEATADAEEVCIVGEFNDWSRGATPLKRRKNGDFSVSLDLETGRSYRFRYLIDDCKFENDWKADRYESNPYGGEDSVVEV